MDLVEPRERLPSWTFLTNHAHVLIALHRDPTLRQRDLSFVVGITIGAVQRIIDELEAEGYLTRTKVGRRNVYEVNADMPLRHPLEAGHMVSTLLVTLQN